MTTEGTNPSPTPPRRTPPPQRKPWPMWPIALAILIFIPVYTYINIQYRKTDKPYEPFQVMMDRMNAPIEKNFYDWYGLKATRADDEAPIAAPAAVSSRDVADPLESEIPDQVKYFLMSKPILAPSTGKPESPSTLQRGQPLRLKLSLPAKLGDDERFRLLAAYKEGQLYLIPTLFVDKPENAADALAGEPRQFAFAIPTDPIEAETVHVHFLTDSNVLDWQIATQPVP